MKNLFAFSNDSSINNCEKFIIRRTSTENIEKFNKIHDECNNLTKRKSLPNWLLYVSLIVGIVGLLGVIGMLFDKDGFLNALEQRWYLFCIDSVLFVAGLVVFIYCWKNMGKCYKDPQVIESYNKLNTIGTEIFSELNIPDSAACIDVFLENTKIDKNGEQKSKKLTMVPYFNEQMAVFVEKDLLCFGDVSLVLGIPIDSFEGIKKINKFIQFPEWHKDVGFRSPEYKQYKIYFNNNGFFYCKPFYEIDFEVDGEQYYFYIPCYDKDNFMKALGIQLAEIDVSKK